MEFVHIKLIITANKMFNKVIKSPNTFSNMAWSEAVEKEVRASE